MKIHLEYICLQVSHSILDIWNNINFEIYLSQMAINDIKLSTMVGENFEMYLSQMAINDLKLSTMVG